MPSENCEKSPTTLAYKASYAVLGALFVVTNFVIIPSNLQMILYTAPIMCIACHQSLKLNNTNADGKKEDIDSVSHKDAMMFPVVGSVALLSLYLAYKLVSPYLMNLLLTGYLGMLGVGALAETVKPLVDSCLPEDVTKNRFHIRFTMPALLMKVFAEKADEDPNVELNFSYSHILVYGISAVLGGYFAWTKQFTIHNMFGVSFCIQAIRLISLHKFSVAFILLAGLFVYDIFWVFGTEVMVFVAKSFDAPAKIIFPLSFDPWKQGILGLGDIVVPGIFISLNMRFDYHQDQVKNKRPAERDVDIHRPFPKPYYHNVLIAYLLGLLTTGIIMQVFNAAQPALLYLVPFTVVAALSTAYSRGELKDMMEYTEGEEKQEEERKKEK
ncbi:minor histocompatibility antigen H13, putative [Perkinsus marinus ATCC 50983]|uniref:Minor histocompatibility antigen H13, putative n=1 Tax=Perkinsus marinus (strain ATCC 50983 / TXsc) TaxID=423536 RepID=C5KML7_PERM5|nr:minor histocompatibility antigen H13, putative [Perkinsus marinus ATCC 50983]EER14175.1 minor histocompatibility antigen H13, putative [Perkinsus marinus ATCC 50983]|eukprot:XP_002782380.1 minor histocompatibility antigen H13, putative [Perkinsus marinus ATCC 50983]